MQSFTRGDLLRGPRAYLVNADGSATDLTGNSLVFRLVSVVDGTIKVNNASATIVTPLTGEVRYDWTAPDIDTVGEYWAWFIRTSGGQTEHFPVGHQYKIVIKDDI